MRPYVLVVENDDDDFNFFVESFKRLHAKHTVRWVRDGVECMDFLLGREKMEAEEEFFLPDIIFLDINMPRKNGFEVLKEIQSQPELREVPIVVLSSETSEDSLARIYELGAFSYIQKTADFGHMVNSLKGYFG